MSIQVFIPADIGASRYSILMSRRYSSCLPACAGGLFNNTWRRVAIVIVFAGLSLLAKAQQDSVIAGNKQPRAQQKAIGTIQRLFEDYIQYAESTDSPEDKKLMKKSLESLGRVTDAQQLEILINVWMYYDPTDFPVRGMVFRILKASRPWSKQAVQARIDHKKDWEAADTAPYDELKDLLKQLDQ